MAPAGACGELSTAEADTLDAHWRARDARTMRLSPKRYSELPCVMTT